jgi:hypothetical protein
MKPFIVAHDGTTLSHLVNNTPPTPDEVGTDDDDPLQRLQREALRSAEHQSTKHQGK